MPPLEQNRIIGQLPRRAPGELVQAQPWSFVVLALSLGVAAGLLWRFKSVRKALGLYLMVRRFV